LISQPTSGTEHVGGAATNIPEPACFFFDAVGRKTKTLLEIVRNFRVQRLQFELLYDH
jgi:hypothetical protein